MLSISTTYSTLVIRNNQHDCCFQVFNKAFA